MPPSKYLSFSLFVQQARVGGRAGTRSGLELTATYLDKLTPTWSSLRNADTCSSSTLAAIGTTSKDRSVFPYYESVI